MSLFSNKKNSRDLAKAEIVSSKIEKSDKVDVLNEFDSITEYKKGLALFMKNENYSCEDEAKKDVSMELNRKVLPKLNLKDIQLPEKTPSEEI